MSLKTTSGLTLLQLLAAFALLALAGGCVREQNAARPQQVEELPAPPARRQDGIRYRLAQSGRISLAVYDANGGLVRELLQAIPQEAGEQVVMWDGLDAEMKGVPPGEYSWKLLQTDGLQAKYLMSVGSNYPPGDTWRTASGPGTHRAPMGVAADDSGIYVAAETTENIETCMLKMTPDGKERLWTALHPRAWDGASSLAADGGELFMLGHVTKGDARIGPEKRRKQLVYVYDAATGKLADHTVSPTAVGPSPVMIDIQWDPESDAAEGSDMDVRDGLMVVAYAKQNAIRLYDPQTGQKLDERAVESPQGVAIGNAGTLYVTSGNRLVRLHRDTPEEVEMVAGLDEPGRVAFDRASGDLLVYLAGPQQIGRFTGDGVLRLIYGEVGGRQAGIYNQTSRRSFAGFGDLAADGAGGFYVTEPGAAPRRTAHFAADGSVIREWYGGQRWAPHAAPEPNNPNVLWVGSQYGWVMRVIADYEAGTWEVHSTYQYSQLANGLVGESWNEGGYFRIHDHNGSKYLVLEKMPTILRLDEEKWQLIPATVCNNTSRAPDFIKEWAAGKASFQWNDANGDGLPQREEMTFYEQALAVRFQPVVDDAFTCFFVSMQPQPFTVRKARVSEWNEAGAPIYADLPLGEAFAPVPPRFAADRHQDTRWASFLYHDTTTGDLYGAFNSWTRTWGASDDSFMQRWDAGGKPIWSVSRQGKIPGLIYNNLRGLAGTAHDCVVAIDFDGGWNMSNLARSYVWDRHGLFVGGLMDNPDLHDSEDFWYQLSGEFCHSSVLTLPDGEVLFFGNWENEMRLYRISGWQNWQRQNGKVMVGAQPADHTGQGLTAEYFADSAMNKRLAVRLDERLDLDWRAGAPPEIGVAESAHFADSAHLAVCWRGTILPEYGPKYSGPWISQNDRNAFDKTVRSSRDDGAAVDFRFKGHSIRVVGRTGPNSGLANVYLNGQLAKEKVDCYSETTNYDVTLFEQEDLPPGDNVLKVEVVGWRGPRNPKATDTWVVLDKFVVDKDLEVDAAGLEHTFTVQTTDKVNLWLERTLKLANSAGDEPEQRAVVVKLSRTHTSLQLDWVKTTEAAAIALLWSSPFSEKEPVPTSALFPVPYGK